jgi:hypothetical protein
MCVVTDEGGSEMARVTEMPSVGDGVTVHGWSDSHAYTVVKVNGATKFTAQRDKATRTNRDDDTFSPGGFFGHTTSPKGQGWSYETDEDGSTITVTRRKDGTFRPSGQGTKPVSMGRHEYYDYNF